MQKVALTHPILIDTREQRPWPFWDLPPDEWDVSTEHATLPTGDYSLKGLQHLILVERKTLSDFANCCGRGRQRFERELTRMRDETRHSYVFVDNTVKAVAEGSYPGRVAPATIIGSFMSWTMKYDTHFLFTGGPAYSVRMVVRLFAALERRIERGEVAA